MRTTRAIRRDREAVSPVIATILMVAITVVLAAVLYVMVSGLVQGPGDVQEPIGYIVRPAGSNWAIDLVDVPAGMANSTLSLIIRDTNGAITFQKASLDTLLSVTLGVQYAPSTNGSLLAPGDTILVDTGTYTAGSTFQLIGSVGIAATGTLG